MQPPLILPQVAMNEVRAGKRRLNRYTSLPRWIDAPVDLYGLLGLAVQQQLEILRNRPAPVLVIAGSHPLLTEYLHGQRRMSLERIGEQDAFASDHLPEFKITGDARTTDFIFHCHHIGYARSAQQYLGRIATRVKSAEVHLHRGE